MTKTWYNVSVLQGKNLTFDNLWAEQHWRLTLVHSTCLILQAVRPYLRTLSNHKHQLSQYNFMILFEWRCGCNWSEMGSPRGNSNLGHIGGQVLPQHIPDRSRYTPPNPFRRQRVLPRWWAALLLIGQRCPNMTRGFLPKGKLVQRLTHRMQQHGLCVKKLTSWYKSMSYTQYGL